MNRLLLHPVTLTLLACSVTIALTISGLHSGESPEELGYVGQTTCTQSGCHAEYENSIYGGAEEFRKTMHQNIHLRPTPENVVIERWFKNDTVLKVYDHRLNNNIYDTLLLEFSKGPLETDYFMQFRFSGPGGDSTEKMRVAYTYGGQGWLQRFLLDVDGSLYVTPFQYILPSYRSTSDTGYIYLVDHKRWYFKNSNIDRFEFYDFTSTRFRELSWDKRCAACHVNGFSIQVDSSGPNFEEKQWTALWVGSESGDSAVRDQNILVGCESCHGPGSAHSENPTDNNIISPGNWPRTKQYTDLKLDMCGQCHERISSSDGVYPYPYDDKNDLPYIPGQRLSNFSVSTARNWRNGETSEAHHQQGQDYKVSRHYKDGTFPDGCWNCHVVHTNTEYPFQLDRDWYTLEEGEGCLAFSCHEGLSETELREGVEYNLHTQHTQAISQCVNCHMTKTASISFGTGVYEFADHSFRVYSPLETLLKKDEGIGMVNSCAASCHRNGRGERNRGPNDPIAPDYGIIDSTWNNYTSKSDIDLADSLWLAYQRMYSKYLSADHISGDGGTATAITAVSPNPLSNTTTVTFQLNTRQDISLDVFDPNGKRLRNLATGRHEKGTYGSEWDGTDETGALLPNGAYFIRLQSGKITSTQKVILLR